MYCVGAAETSSTPAAPGTSPLGAVPWRRPSAADLALGEQRGDLVGVFDALGVDAQQMPSG